MSECERKYTLISHSRTPQPDQQRAYTHTHTNTHTHTHTSDSRTNSEQGTRTTSAIGSGGATDEEHGAAEMFGRRKLQLVLDVSRVADIKVLSCCPVSCASSVLAEVVPINSTL